MDKIAVSQYMEILVHKIYKNLPIFEQCTFDIYQRNIRDLMDEVGVFYLDNRHKYILELKNELGCLLDPYDKPDEDAHSYVRRRIFEVINTTKRIKKSMEEEDEECL